VLFVRGAQQLFRLLGPAEANELDEAQHVAPGVGAAVPGGSALEHLGDTSVEGFGAGLERWREMAGQHRRHFFFHRPSMGRGSVVAALQCMSRSTVAGGG
jgi:hypothetical protein